MRWAGISCKNRLGLAIAVSPKVLLVIASEMCSFFRALVIPT
jgi:hypothetical protein